VKKYANRLICLIAAVAVALPLNACGASGESPAPGGQLSEPQGNNQSVITPSTEMERGGAQVDDADENTVTVVDQAGREVEIETPVENIVSGYYISSSACIALGLQEKLVGIEAKADSRPIYAMSAPELLELPNVGTAKEFNLEGCIALEPDLVILPSRLRDSADTIAGLGIPVILVSPENHEDIVDMIALIGDAAGAEEKAAALTRYYKEELVAVAGLTADMAEKPAVYMGGNSAYLSTAPKDMYQATLIEAAGGINAAWELEGDNWTDISYEQLIAMNPDVIVIPPEAGYGKEDIFADSQLSGITAVKEGKVYQMPKGFEAWDSPVPSCTLGIRWMLNVLHEDVYPIEELRAAAAAFYREFYNAEIDIDLIGK